MTIAIKGNAQGGVIEANGVTAANVTSFSGLPFCKNKLFNGEVTRINQRNFDGNWATKNTWAAGNTIAQQEACYGYDMWAKASATDMVQPIEAGNFRPSTVHTISGLNMTTRQETSPASGNWNIVVPQAARNVQVEEGLVATPFEIRPNGFEGEMCRRYYFNSPMPAPADNNGKTTIYFANRVRGTPHVGLTFSAGTGTAAVYSEGVHVYGMTPGAYTTSLLVSAVI